MADTINYRFRCRRRTAANWTTLNEILLPQEIGLETDTGLGKVGDDAGTPWNSLLYTIVGRVDLDGLADGKCLAWDAASGTWKIANRGAVYVPGSGISIDSTNPESPVINSTLGSISLSGNPTDYASLPSGLTLSDAGKAYLLKSDGLTYIWDGAAFPANGSGIHLGTAAPFIGPLGSYIPGTQAMPTSFGKFFEIKDGADAWLIPAVKKYILPNPGMDDFSTDTTGLYTIGGDTAAGYSISGGALTMSGGVQSTLLHGSLTFADGVLHAVISRAGDAGFVFRVQDNNNYYVAVVSDSSGVTPEVVKLYKRVAGVYTQLGTNTAISYATNTNHDFEVDVSGSSIQIKFDGVVKLAATDSAITAAGGAGLRNNGTSSVWQSFDWSF